MQRHALGVNKQPTLDDQLLHNLPCPSSAEGVYLGQAEWWEILQSPPQPPVVGSVNESAACEGHNALSGSPMGEWTAVVVEGSKRPPPRYEHAHAVLGNSMYIIGGNCGELIVKHLTYEILTYATDTKLHKVNTPDLSIGSATLLHSSSLKELSMESPPVIAFLAFLSGTCIAARYLFAAQSYGGLSPLMGHACSQEAGTSMMCGL